MRNNSLLRRRGMRWIFPVILSATIGANHVLASDVESLNIDSEQVTSRKTSKRKVSRAKSSSHVERSVINEEDDFNFRKAQEVFTRLDKLYYSVLIKVQKVDEKSIPGEPVTTNLFEFLTGPHTQEEVVVALEGELRRGLKEREKKLIAKCSPMSLTEAIRTLYKNSFIGEVKAHAMMVGSAPMTGTEILNLIDLGAVQTKSGYLINMRTGKGYGDPITLFADYNALVGELKKVHTSSADSISAENLLLAHEVPEDIASAVREYGATYEDMLSDARVISEVRRHMAFLSRINLPISFRPGTTDFRPNAIATVGAPVNMENFNGVMWALLKNLNAVIMSNHYFADHNSSITNSLMLAPFGATYWGAYNWTSGGVGWWLSYTEKYLGIGGSYTANFAKGAFWSNGAPTYLQVGATVSGWRNSLSAGVSLMTMMSSTVGVGASVMGTVTRDHDVFYKGQYPLDGRFPEIRGLHKIEIFDRKGIALQESVAANFSNLHVPVMVAFRAGQEFTLSRVYRTHLNLPDTQGMLSEADVPGVLYLLGKDIKVSKLPSFDEPQKFKVGDEFIETKVGKLSGAFVVGLQAQLPIAAVRGGITGEISAEFELALRRLPGNFYEVSIEPKRIYDWGVFASILNTIGAGYNGTVSVARKQSFIFDFSNPTAVMEYNALINKGELPIAKQIDVKHYTVERGPEYLINEFREQNREMESRGIALNYLEHVQVGVDKISIGLNSRMLAGMVDLANIYERHFRKEHARHNYHFDGIDWQAMQADSMSVATNGVVAVRRTTVAHRKSEGQGFSGRADEDLYATHTRVHMIDESSRQLVNKWNFGSLLVHAQYQDNRITGEQDNDIASKINRAFGTFFGSFEREHSRQQRIVNLERELTVVDFERLTQPRTEKYYASRASRASGIAEHSIKALLSRLRDTHHVDEQALIVKAFMETQPGVSGFAAIHQLLGALPEDLHIRTEAGYTNAINGAKKYIATIADANSDLSKGRNNFKPYKNRHNKKRLKNAYKLGEFHLGEIEQQLEWLDDDKYMIDARSELNKFYGKERVDRLVKAGVWESKESKRVALVTARETIRKELDLSRQGFNEHEIKRIYDMVGKRHLRFADLGRKMIMKYRKDPLSADMSKSSLKKRFSEVKDMVHKTNDRIEVLKHNRVMRRMDKDYVVSKRAELESLRNELFGLVNLCPLDVAARQRIERKVGDELYTEVSLFNVCDGELRGTVDQLVQASNNN